MPLLDQIKFNAAKVRNFVTREGFAAFFHYAVVTAIMGMADLLLYPFKRRSCNEIFYDVFDNYVEKVNGMDNPRILEIGSRNVKGTVRRSLFTGNCEYIPIIRPHGLYHRGGRKSTRFVSGRGLFDCPGNYKV